MILKIELTGHPKSSTQRSNSYSTLAPSITNSLAGRSLKVTLPNSSSGTAVSVMANGWLCPWFFYNTKKKWLTNFYHQHKYYLRFSNKILPIQRPLDEQKLLGFFPQEGLHRHAQLHFPADCSQYQCGSIQRTSQHPVFRMLHTSKRIRRLKWIKNGIKYVKRLFTFAVQWTLVVFFQLHVAIGQIWCQPRFSPS